MDNDDEVARQFDRSVRGLVSTQRALEDGKIATMAAAIILLLSRKGYLTVPEAREFLEEMMDPAKGGLSASLQPFLTPLDQTIMMLGATSQ